MKKKKITSRFSSLGKFETEKIVSFLVSPKDLFSLLKVNKKLHSFITKKESCSNRSIQFQIFKDQKNPKVLLPNKKKIQSQMNYVKNLKVVAHNIEVSSLKKQILKFPNLEELDISYCKFLDDFLFSSKEVKLMLNKLKRLDISAGGSFTSETFQHLTNLEELVIDMKIIFAGGKKRELTGEDCKNLSKLKVLITSFITVKKECFQYLPSLEVLDICSHMGGTLENVAKNCPKLKEIKFYSRGFSRFNKKDCEALKAFKNLKKLQIWQHKFKKDIKDYSFLENLEELNISGKILEDDCFKYCKKLKKLKIMRSKNTAKIFNMLPNLQIFESDGINGSFFTNESIKLLSKVKTVKLCCDSLFSPLTNYKKKCKNCKSDHIYCPNCDKCQICQNIICKSNNQECKHCKKLMCSKCDNHCEKCSKYFCKNCNSIKFGAPLCMTCEIEMCCLSCFRSFSRCETCRQTCCKTCLKNGLCMECRCELMNDDDDDDYF